jgi:peptidoglycan/LPS O-acetylase OafA/YrhL
MQKVERMLGMLSFQSEITNENSGANGLSRVEELQTIRGIAALIVILHHAFFYYAPRTHLSEYVNILLNSHAAVILFFVLSGYVLALALLKYRITINSIAEFYFRRMFRIYPAIWVSCCLSVLIIFLLQIHSLGGVQASEWASRYFRTDGFTAWSVLSSFVGYGNYLNPPLWSIRVELVGSLLMPLMVLIMIRSKILFIACLLSLVVVSFLGVDAVSTSNFISYLDKYTLGAYMHLFNFALGASIVLWGKSVLRLGVWASRALAIFALVGLLAGRSIGGWSLENDFNAPLPALVESLSSALFIAVVAYHRNVIGWLSSRRCLTLGNMSYSMYLLHFPLMVGIAIALSREMGLQIFSSGVSYLASLGLMLFTLLLTLPLAWVSFKYIENGGIIFGKRVMKYFQRTA